MLRSYDEFLAGCIKAQRLHREFDLALNEYANCSPLGDMRSKEHKIYETKYRKLVRHIDGMVYALGGFRKDGVWHLNGRELATNWLFSDTIDYLLCGPKEGSAHERMMEMARIEEMKSGKMPKPTKDKRPPLSSAPVLAWANK